MFEDKPTFAPNKTIKLLHRYTSSVYYDSDRHFIQGVALQPWGQGLEHCQQTIMAVSHSTWRRYKTQLDFQPRHRPQHFKSTTIIYPKRTSAVFSTELSYNSHRLSRRFLSSVELEAIGRRELPQWEWEGPTGVWGQHTSGYSHGPYTVAPWGWLPLTCCVALLYLCSLKSF